MNLIKVLEYNPPLFESIVELANESFGSGYMSLASICEVFDPNTFLFVAEESGGLCGYCLCVLVNFDSVAEHMKLPPDISARYRETAGQVCYIKSMAVTVGCRGTPLARELFAATFSDIIKHGANSAIGSAWKIGDKVPMHRIFTDYDLTPIAELSDIWYDDEDYVCTVCNGRCRCQAVIYYKSLGGKNDYES
jgi:predicted GNAT superfamily acetyltransferase